MEIGLLIGLIAIISIIAYAVAKMKDKKPVLEKTMSIDPTSEGESIEVHSSENFKQESSTLATVLRIIGCLNGFGGVVLGLAAGYDLGVWTAIVVIYSGIMGCVFCFAFAKCVDAAHEYLNKP